MVVLFPIVIAVFFALFLLSFVPKGSFVVRLRLRIVTLVICLVLMVAVWIGILYPILANFWVFQD
jgi:hypothetical protein